jgi:hypothetical protein
MFNKDSTGGLHLLAQNLDLGVKSWIGQIHYDPKWQVFQNLASCRKSKKSKQKSMLG